jgi:hypothetical protein
MSWNWRTRSVTANGDKVLARLPGLDRAIGHVSVHICTASVHNKSMESKQPWIAATDIQGGLPEIFELTGDGLIRMINRSAWNLRDKNWVA